MELKELKSFMFVINFVLDSTKELRHISNFGIYHLSN